jgi:hypothetical protein
MGFERNCQVKILSNQINMLRNYTISNTHKAFIKSPILNEWFVTGFADAEASFSILIQHNNSYKTN